MRDPLKLIWFVFRLGFPLYIVLMPLLVLYGYFQPWQPAVPILNSYTDQSKLLVGVSYRGEHEKVIVSRTYLLLPSELHPSKTVTVQRTDQESPVVSESEAGGLLSFLVSLLVGLGGTWYYWIRPRRKASLSPSIKRDALKRTT